VESLHDRYLINDSLRVLQVFRIRNVEAWREASPHLPAKSNDMSAAPRLTQEMRVTVTHNKGLAGAKKLVDDSAAELFKARRNAVQIVDQETLGRRHDALFIHRKMGFSPPDKGWVLVTEKDVTIECELPSW
jgi:hypothetical protein